ncbi:MAG: DUF4982 domain-containing protein [Prevotellaceae bacterium]|jgi:beta-galactosidase|nr:DUF4982 domain-containing protein [Prevotellaceae bacterium]
MRTTILLLACLLGCQLTGAQTVRERISINDNWKFAYGDASSMQKDFQHGLEYFTYFAKAAAFNRSKAPISTEFDDSQWQTVNLPHDWVVDLPYSGQASHSHGYKTVGWRYPQTSIGWYRKRFEVPEEDFGKRIYVEYEAIFRNAQLFCNGFYLGTEPSGYASQVYDVTDYLNYGGENILTVRVDATTEEGWYYEGAGIYQNVWLHKMAPVHVAPFGTYVTTDVCDCGSATVNVETKLFNDGNEKTSFQIVQRLIDAEGLEVAKTRPTDGEIAAKSGWTGLQLLQVNAPELWDLDYPYLYTLHTDIYIDGKLTDTYPTTFGIRTAVFDPEQGFLLNGKPVKLKGTNLHLDHAGVGVAVPEGLWEYRIRQLKAIGSNAIRSSHNPAAVAMLDLCDRLGMLVIDENRLMGTNKEHIDWLERMIVRDRNHPSIILWSIGNEEWALEGNEMGLRIAHSMSAYVHQIDSTRPTTAGISGGTVMLAGTDVKGYNYIRQNNVDGFHRQHPDWKAYGAEETSGSGTRGVYFTDRQKGWMAAINRVPERNRNQRQAPKMNVIETGWQFYDERPWLGGLFYWTGFDYRGEPNPMSFPATGSQFGILDYCGFPKDEAYYLKSWWTDEPVLHILPHWNLKGHEGDTVSVWAYSNCDEVELIVNGKRLGRQSMPKNGHLEWTAVYQPGKVEARGYKNGKRIIQTRIETTGEATNIRQETHKFDDLQVINLSLFDKKGHEVPDAMNAMQVSITGAATILGYGNGNPAFQEVERPAAGSNPRQLDIHAFSGKAQLLIRPDRDATEPIAVHITGEGLQPITFTLP